MHGVLLAQSGEGFAAFVGLVILGFCGIGVLRLFPRLRTLHDRVYYWVVGLSITTGVLTFFAQFGMGGARREEDVGTMLFNGLIAAIVASLSFAFLIPCFLFVCFYIIAPPFRLIGRFRRGAAKRQAQRNEDERRRRLSEPAPRSPDRDRAQKRREDARARCEMLYNLHFHEIGSRFTREMFDDFMKKYMGDNKEPEYVEEREQQLKGIIEQTIDKVHPVKEPRTVEEANHWLREQKAGISAADIDADMKEILVIELERRYDALLKRLIRGGS